MIEWPAYTVERWELARLKPYERNARTHSPRQLGQIRAAMRAYGWTVPILAREDGTVIAGHGRLEAARSEGYGEAPVIVARGWSDEQCRAYALADNRIAENSTWDEAMLGLELADLSAVGVDLPSLGFEALELNGLLGDKRGRTDPDAEAPALPAVATTRAGELWIIGDHRLLCGDATKGADVGRVRGAARPLLMIADPPYGVEYDPEWRNAEFGRAVVGGRAVGKVRNDDRVDWREAWLLFSGDVAYVWHDATQGPEVGAGLKAVGFELRVQIVWGKSQLVIGRGHYHSKHEPCWYAVRAGGRAHWAGDHKQTTLWDDIDKPRKSETGHSTQKPVECMRRPMLNNSRPGDAVYDPFLGSGTSMIAAEMTRRRCIGLEIEPAYCDVAVKRWQAFTGGAATLEGDGRTFDEIEAERAAARDGTEEDKGHGTRTARRAGRHKGDEGQSGQAATDGAGRRKRARGREVGADVHDAGIPD